MATSEELVAAVLERIEEAGVGQPLGSEDVAKVTAALPRLFALLLDTNIVLEPIDTRAINESQFFPLRSYIAWKLSGDFGLSGSAALASEASQAVDELKTLARINRGTRQALRVDRALMPRRRWSFTRVGG